MGVAAVRRALMRTHFVIATPHLMRGLAISSP